MNGLPADAVQVRLREVSPDSVDNQEAAGSGTAPSSMVTAAEFDQPTRLAVAQADRANDAWLQLTRLFSERTHEAAKTGQLFGLVPAFAMLLVGAAMILTALVETVNADPDAVGVGGQFVVMTGTALGTAEFIVVMVVGSVLLLAAPVAVYASGALARKAVADITGPQLDGAKDDKQKAESNVNAVLASQLAYRRYQDGQDAAPPTG